MEQDPSIGVHGLAVFAIEEHVFVYKTHRPGAVGVWIDLSTLHASIDTGKPDKGASGRVRYPHGVIQDPLHSSVGGERLAFFDTN